MTVRGLIACTMKCKDESLVFQQMGLSCQYSAYNKITPALQLNFFMSSDVQQRYVPSRCTETDCLVYFGR